jgi:hypothetical protein
MGKNSVTIRDCVAHACLLLPSAFVYALVCQAVGVRSVEWDRSLFSRDAMIALSRWARRGGIGPISYCVRASVSDVLATFSLSLGYRSWRSREWVKRKRSELENVSITPSVEKGRPKTPPRYAALSSARLRRQRTSGAL